ncbi:MAG: TonB-dependent receptor domain-containing protein, partial [Pyrinomonadaceae bacterium]
YYAVQRDNRIEPILQGNTIPGFGDTRESRRQIFTLNETHTFGPNLVNEARFGFNRIRINFTPNSLLNPADFGINNGINEDMGLPQIAVAGGPNLGGPAGFPQQRADTTFVVSDSVNYLRGPHSFVFGGEFRNFYNNNLNGDTGAFTFTNLGEFVKGNVNTFNITLGDQVSSILQKAVALFVQDNYKVRQNLTLELGLRYDLNLTPTERFDRFVVFDPTTASLVRVGTNGLDQIYQTDANNFQPRIGIAWDPFKDGKTSVRAAYAVLVDQPVTNLVAGATTNPPLADPRTIAASNNTPPISLENALTLAQIAGLAPASVDSNFSNAYIQSYNLNVQREVSPGLAVTVGYFGSKGTHLRIARNINQFVNGVRPFTTVSSASPILPGATLGNITEIGSGGDSSYNALWVTANKRFARGLQFNASYTFSKSI